MRLESNVHQSDTTCKDTHASGTSLVQDRTYMSTHYVFCPFLSKPLEVLSYNCVGWFMIKVALTGQRSVINYIPITIVSALYILSC